MATQELFNKQISKLTIYHDRIILFTLCKKSCTISSMKKKETSVLEHILLGFIPFTEENTSLVYKPGKFFNQLERKLGSRTTRSSIKSTISRAKRQGYLKEIENKNLRLTNKGRVKILRLLSSQKKKGAWDGYWRILFFDIPEKERKKRDILRNKLKELGFERYQLSTWICPYDYTEEIDLLLEEYEIRKYVHYLMAKTISGEDTFKSIFKL